LALIINIAFPSVANDAREVLDRIDFRQRRGCLEEVPIVALGPMPKPASGMMFILR
jgi:hypothetical protein